MNGSDPVTEFAGFWRMPDWFSKELPVMDGKIHRVPTADDKKGQKVAHIADSRTADLPAGTGDYRSADDSPITGPSPAENRQIPSRKTPPESAFNATQGGRGAGTEKHSTTDRPRMPAAMSTNGRRPQHMNT